MFVDESKTCKTIEMGTQLSCFYSLGKPKCQLVTIKRYYHKTGKLKMSLKKRCFAKSCRNGCARPANKHVMKWRWRANKSSEKK